MDISKKRNKIRGSVAAFIELGGMLRSYWIGGGSEVSIGDLESLEIDNDIELQEVSYLRIEEFGDVIVLWHGELQQTPRDERERITEALGRPLYDGEEYLFYGPFEDVPGGRFGKGHFSRGYYGESRG